MTLDETIERIQGIVDKILVKLAETPQSRYLIDLPPLSGEDQDAPLLDCQEYHYGIASLREVITYKYLLRAFKAKQLAIDRESLSACLQNLRKSPVIDYYDLGDYHEYAFYFYKQSGMNKKAMRHLLSCYMDRGRAILSSGKTFDCKDLLVLLLKDHQRMESLLLYVVDFILNDFEDIQPYLKRSQYLLLERSLLLAVKLMAENSSCPVDLRCCIYAAQALYDELTHRSEDAKVARESYMSLGGERNYTEVLAQIQSTHSAPHLMDERFVDALLYRPYLEDYQIYPMDKKGNVDLDADVDYFVLAKDGRGNFMDTFYRPMEGTLDFKEIYERAERGEEEAIRVIVRRYREGDGVTACEVAARAWEKRLLSQTI